MSLEVSKHALRSFNRVRVEYPLLDSLDPQPVCSGSYANGVTVQRQQPRLRT